MTTDELADGRGALSVETLLLSLALWWGLWRSASRLTHRWT
jgi:low temperature requirement protein LtrA